MPRARLSWQISWHGQTRCTKPQNLCFTNEAHWPTINLDRKSLGCPKPQPSLRTVQMRTIPFWYWIDRRVSGIINIQYLEAFGNQYPISGGFRNPISNIPEASESNIQYSNIPCCDLSAGDTRAATCEVGAATRETDAATGEADELPVRQTQLPVRQI